MKTQISKNAFQTLQDDNAFYRKDKEAKSYINSRQQGIPILL